VVVVCAAPSAVWADGGTLRLAEVKGHHHIMVFTAPTPLRAGPVEVSVLVREAPNNLPREVPVVVRAHPVGEPGQCLSAPVVPEATTNRLLQAARLELPHGGRWCIEVEVQGVSEPLRFEVEVDESLPAWASFAPWVGWPFVVVLLFAIHLALVQRRRRKV
jgi:hypothetical protein